jgi:hypothetical protein
VGLKALGFKLFFENGIMSIPQLTAGRNSISFKVSDSKALKAPVSITYDYKNSQGAVQHKMTLEPKDFNSNHATYIVNAPGLLRCEALKIEYR